MFCGKTDKELDEEARQALAILIEQGLVPPGTELLGPGYRPPATGGPDVGKEDEK